MGANNYGDTSVDARAQTVAQTAAGMAQATADTNASQGEAERFMAEHGAAVLDGHATVEGPAGASDASQL